MLDPRALHFYNRETGESCRHEAIVTTTWWHTVTWSGDEVVLISAEGKTYQGAPCGELAEVIGAVPTAQSPYPTTYTELSPEGTYRATTAIEDARENHFPMITTITEEATGRITNRLEWAHRGVEGNPGLGGRWVSERDFLIFEALERGPLLLTVDRSEAIEVAPELFGVPAIPPTPSVPPSEPAASVRLYALGSAVRGEAYYHLSLQNSGDLRFFEPVKLYHSESGLVETLDFVKLWGWGFSPDGRWVLGYEEVVSRQRVSGYQFLIRPVDPPGSAVRPFGRTFSYMQFSPDGSRMAQASDNAVWIYAFPEGDLLGVWYHPQYDLTLCPWSPDGQSLIVIGFNIDRVENALFVITP